jgi:hypothetical protein
MPNFFAQLLFVIFISIVLSPVFTYIGYSRASNDANEISQCIGWDTQRERWSAINCQTNKIYSFFDLEDEKERLKKGMK